MEEECFAPCKGKKEGTQAAREGRASEPETPPKVPGDDPVGEKTVFGKNAAEVVLESKMASPML